MTTSALNVYRSLTTDPKRLAKIYKDLDTNLADSNWLRKTNLSSAEGRLDFNIRYPFVLTAQEQLAIKANYPEWGMIFTVQGQETVLQLYADAAPTEISGPM